MKLLAELCEACGVPGREERVREIVRRELEPLVDEMRTDAMGSVIAMKRGSGRRKLAVQAHMDEIGFLVKYLDEDGFLRLQPLGGHDPRNMMAQRVAVLGKRDLAGLLYAEVKPPHLQTPEDRQKLPKVNDFFVDVGLPEAEVRELVPIGTPVIISRHLETIGHSVSCKGLDDRVALYVMIEAVRRAKRSAFTLYPVATCQEEVGCRGATTTAFEIDPDVGIAIDVTIASDIPGVNKHEHVTCLGKGAAIKIMDSLSISSPRLVEALRTLAERHEIRHQMEILPSGGTDAGPLQRTRSGVPVATLSVPTRYVHSSVEMAHKDDIEAAIQLLAAFIEEGHEFDLSL